MILYDLHCHSTFSDGYASVAYLIDRAAKGGYKTDGIGDHLVPDRVNIRGIPAPTHKVGELMISADRQRLLQPFFS